MIKCTSGGFRCHDAHVNIPAPVTPRHPAHSTSWLRHTHFSTLHDSSPERFLASCKSLSRAHSSAVSLSHGPRAQTSAAAASSQRRATTACAPSTSKTEACKPKVCSLAMASHPVTPEAISSRAMQPSLAGGLHPHCTQTYERKPSVLPLALARRIRPCFFGVGTPAYAQNSPITCAQCNTPARNHTTTSAFGATVLGSATHRCSTHGYVSTTRPIFPACPLNSLALLLRATLLHRRTDTAHRHPPPRARPLQSTDTPQPSGMTLTALDQTHACL